MYLPTIALTMGDPAGIGPELCVRVIANSELTKKIKLVVLGDAFLLEKISRKILKRSLPSRRCLIYDFKNISSRLKMGVPNAAAGKASGDYIREAVSLAIQKKVDAIVTAPINKKSFMMGGWGEKYKGHTEMLASLTKTEHVALMLTAGFLRAVHVTSHISLKSVSQTLSVDRIVRTLLLAKEGVTSLGVKKPKIGVSALNPHGGEDGIMGTEENNIIVPAIKKARQKGTWFFGPYPSDTLWPFVLARKFDAGVAMYHDQGQIPVKLAGSHFDKHGKFVPGGVNITLGLPIIRTSPAHGTAFDIAGRGIASEESLMEAISTAINISQRKNIRSHK